MTRHAWTEVAMGPPDGILGLVEAFQKDDFPKKVNLSVGAYRSDEGKPWVLPSVKKAEERVLAASMNKEYAPIHGVNDFVETARAFALGKASPALAEGRVASVQSLSGTGACRVIGEFYRKFLPPGAAIYMPDPTWGNHANIFRSAGLDVRSYRYLDRQTNGLDLDGMIADLSEAPEGSAVLLHACAHNPTGVDPTTDDWKRLCTALKARPGLSLFFDSAYQGFASGDAEADAFSIRHFVSEGVPFALAQVRETLVARSGRQWGRATGGERDARDAPMAACAMRRLRHAPPAPCAARALRRPRPPPPAPSAACVHRRPQPHARAVQSFAKNFGLYGERVGVLSMICDDAEEAGRILSQFKIIVRGMYSNPPIHGARIVATVLGDEGLEAEWRAECKTMADRIITMRDALRAGVAQAGSTHDWGHITSQIGMFCYTGMSEAQVGRLKDEYHIYITKCAAAFTTSSASPAPSPPAQPPRATVPKAQPLLAACQGGREHGIARLLIHDCRGGAMRACCIRGCSARGG